MLMGVYWDVYKTKNLLYKDDYINTIYDNLKNEQERLTARRRFDIIIYQCQKQHIQSFINVSQLQSSMKQSSVANCTDLSNEKNQHYHKKKRVSTEFYTLMYVTQQKNSLCTHLNTDATYTNISESQKQI